MTLSLGLIGFVAEFGSKILNYGVPFLFVLSLVVFVHEFGHFIVARWCGVKVETFSIGFGRALVSWKDRLGTVWKIGWLPLGGYVKFVGDEGPASTPDRAAMERLVASGEAADPEAVKGYFHFKPIGQRALVVAAGPIANFIFAILVFAAMYSIIGENRSLPKVEVRENTPAAAAGFRTGDTIVAIDGRKIESFEEANEIVMVSGGRSLKFALDRAGAQMTVRAVPATREVQDRFGNKLEMGDLGLEGYVPARVDDVSLDSPAAAAGLRKGDVILAIDGRPIETFGQIQSIVSVSADRRLELLIRRGGQQLTLGAMPKAHDAKDAAGKPIKIGQLGLSGGQGSVIYIRHDPFTAVWRGIDRTGFVVKETLGYVGDMIVGRRDGSQLSGVVGIAKMSGDIAQLGIIALINLAAMLSISIGLINLFPIPLLDGGHLMYYAYEAARGRPLGARAQELGFRIGLAFVISMMVFATWNDLVKLQFFGG
jgi:regulator of sigma E protease